MRFIIVTRVVDGAKIYVNPMRICSIYPYYKKETTVIDFGMTNDAYLEVSESVNTVVKLCMQVED